MRHISFVGADRIVYICCGRVLFIYFYSVGTLCFLRKDCITQIGYKMSNGRSDLVCFVWPNLMGFVSCITVALLIKELSGGAYLCLHNSLVLSRITSRSRSKKTHKLSRLIPRQCNN